MALLGYNHTCRQNMKSSKDRGYVLLWELVTKNPTSNKVTSKLTLCRELEMDDYVIAK